MTARAVFEAAADPAQRLRWLVCRRLGCAYGALSDREVLLCGAHMLLDRGGEWAVNESFDPERFAAGGGGGDG